MPITPNTGALFHAETHNGDWCCLRVQQLKGLVEAPDKWTTGALSNYPEERVSAIEVSAWL
jgi:hypothetical protein